MSSLNDAVFRAGDRLLRIRFVTDSVARITYTRGQDFLDRPSRVVRSHQAGDSRVRTSRRPAELRLSTRSLTLTLNKTTGALTYFDAAGELLTREPAQWWPNAEAEKPSPATSSTRVPRSRLSRASMAHARLSQSTRLSSIAKHLKRSLNSFLRKTRHSSGLAPTRKAMAICAAAPRALSAEHEGRRPASRLHARLQHVAGLLALS